MDRRLKALHNRVETLESEVWRLRSEQASLEQRLWLHQVPDRRQVPDCYERHFQNVRTLLLDVRTDLRELQFWRAAVTDKYEKNYDTGEIDLHSLD